MYHHDRAVSVFLTGTRYAAGLGLLLAVLPVTLGAKPADAAKTKLEAPSSARPDDVPFRLGTAGSPFERSTAIGDVNADGRPDVIVADRASQWTRGTGYRLDFAISGETATSVTFQTNEEAIGIRLADIDHDSDLDIVLSSAVSGRTIAVWLNDGAGHFTRSSMPLPASAVLTPDTLDRGLPDGPLISGDLPPRRGVGLPAPRARAPSRARISAPVSALVRPFVARLVDVSAAPRAPPLSHSFDRS